MNINKTNRSGGYTPYVVIATMMFIGIMAVGLNQIGNKQLASPSCATEDQINTLLSNKTKLENQITEMNKLLTENNNKTVSLQVSLVSKKSEISKISSFVYSTSTLQQYKQIMDSASTTYNKYKTTRTKSLWTSAKNTYDGMVSKNTSNNSKLAVLNKEKSSIDKDVISTDKRYVELNEKITKLTGELSKLKSAIESAQANLCLVSETLCSDKIDNDNDSKVDCSDSDCSGGADCATLTNVMLTLVSVDSLVTSGDLSNDDLGTFKIKFKVKAVGDDVYVSSLVGNAVNYEIDRNGVAISTGHNSVSATITNVTDTNKTSVGNYVVEDGVEETFILTTSIQLGGDIVSGMYRTNLTGFKWSASDVSSPSNTYSSNLLDFRTSYVGLN